MADFFQTVEADVKGAVQWVEAEVDAALTDIWTLARPIFVAAEPTIVSAVLAALVKFLSTASADIIGNDFAGIEQAFLQDLEVVGSDLFGTAQGLGSNLLQILIALAKNAAPKG